MGKDSLCHSQLVLNDFSCSGYLQQVTYLPCCCWHVSSGLRYTKCSNISDLKLVKNTVLCVLLCMRRCDSGSALSDRWLLSSRLKCVQERWQRSSSRWWMARTAASSASGMLTWVNPWYATHTHKDIILKSHMIVELTLPPQVRHTPWLVGTAPPRAWVWLQQRSPGCSMWSRTGRKSPELVSQSECRPWRSPAARRRSPTSWPNWRRQGTRRHQALLCCWEKIPSVDPRYRKQLALWALFNQSHKLASDINRGLWLDDI